MQSVPCFFNSRRVEVDFCRGGLGLGVNLFRLMLVQLTAACKETEDIFTEAAKFQLVVCTFLEECNEETRGNGERE